MLKHNLRDFVVLKPQWLTKAISRVMEDAQLAREQGEITHERLHAIWQNDYPGLEGLFHGCMKEFELSYDMEDERGCLVPLRFGFRPPQSIPWSKIPGARQRRIEYRFHVTPPAGIMSRFIVKTHHMIVKTPEHPKGVYWHDGVFLATGQGAIHRCQGVCKPFRMPRAWWEKTAPKLALGVRLLGAAVQIALAGLPLAAAPALYEPMKKEADFMKELAKHLKLEGGAASDFGEEAAELVRARGGGPDQPGRFQLPAGVAQARHPAEDREEDLADRVRRAVGDLQGEAHGLVHQLDPHDGRHVVRLAGAARERILPAERSSTGGPRRGRCSSRR